MAKKINPKYIGLHFGLGEGKELKITESTPVEAVEVLESNFPDIYIAVTEDVPEDFLAPNATLSLSKGVPDENISSDAKATEGQSTEVAITDGDGLPEKQPSTKRKP